MSNLIKIAFVQLQSPFDLSNPSKGELDHSEGKYVWIDENAYFTKIEGILNQLAKIDNPHTPEIVVFPEYSIPSNKLDEIKKYSEKFKVIVAGTDICRDKTNEQHYMKNICTVFAAKKSYKIEKNQLADPEHGHIKEGDLDKSTLNLKWSYMHNKEKKDAVIQIYICLDYIRNLDNLYPYNSCTIVPMCSTSMREFSDRAYQDSKRLKFTILCNTISCEFFDDMTKGYAGQSAIYDPLDRERSKLLTPKEGIILAKLDMQWHDSHRKTKPIIYSKKYYFDSAYNFKEVENKAYGIIRNFDVKTSNHYSTQFPAAVYPLVLLQLVKQKNLINAISFFKQDETFWTRRWGTVLNGANGNPENKRIFVVDGNEEIGTQQVKELWSVLEKHSAYYNVYVTTKLMAEKIAELSNDFAMIDDGYDKIVAEYTTSPHINHDEKVDRKINFTMNPINISQKQEIFENLVSKSAKFERTSIFEEFIRQVY